MSSNPDWRPELVALDIDGTLVDFDGTFADGVRDAVQAVLDAGVHVVLVTGRSWHAARPVFEDLGLPASHVVASNGALRLTYPPFEIRHIVTFDATDIIERVHRMHQRAALAVEVVGQGYRVTKPFPVGELHGQIEEVPVEELAQGPVTRVIVRDPDASDGEFERMADALGLHGVSYFIGWTAWLDIAPEGTDKARALAAVCEELGVDQANVLAIGDGRNDMEMLVWAGRGVALGDAAEEVRALANHVTDHFHEGGTVNELRRWFR